MCGFACNSLLSFQSRLPPSASDESSVYVRVVVPGSVWKMWLSIGSSGHFLLGFPPIFLGGQGKPQGALAASWPIRCLDGHGGLDGGPGGSGLSGPADSWNNPVTTTTQQLLPPDTLAINANFAHTLPPASSPRTHRRQRQKGVGVTRSRQVAKKKPRLQSSKIAELGQPPPPRPPWLPATTTLPNRVHMSRLENQGLHASPAASIATKTCARGTSGTAAEQMAREQNQMAVSEENGHFYLFLHPR
jgi:hypothetical protein